MRLTMKILTRTVCALLLSVLSLSAAQARSEISAQDYGSDRQMSRFRWEGVVDGATVIRISRRQVDYEYRSGLPVQRQRYDFTDALPFTRTEVRLNVIEGRGDVRLIEQPRSENNYTAAVLIEDRDRGNSTYAFELLWERPRNSGGRRRDDEAFEWRGRVDGESIIRVRGGSVRVENISGSGVSDDDYRFTVAMPLQPFQVSLVETSGRGEIVLIEQPSRRNDYTVAIRIRDSQGGAGRYAFTLTWQPPRYQPPSAPDRSRGNPRYDDQPVGVGLVWSGRVDGTDLLRISASQLFIEHQNGVPIVGADYRFLKPLPFAPRTVSVRKLRGRGKVTVIEQPSSANNFTATIRIEDKDGGSAQYEIEVSW